MSRRWQRAGTALLVVLLTTGLGCKGLPANVVEATKPTTLTMWGVYDNQDAYDGYIHQYQIAHPYVSVVYKKLRPEEYESVLVNALSEDRGPDLFMVHNTWVTGYQKKLAPMPTQVAVGELIQQGGISKSQIYELHTKPSPSIKTLTNLFPDQVLRDAVIPGRDTKGVVTKNVFALPLSIDTLALYWNRSLLNAAGIAQPPVTWEQVQKNVKKLTKTDTQNTILQSGIAMGTAKNVNRPTDILSLLMMQNGTVMTDDFGNPSFQRIPAEMTDITTPPSLDAAIFYTDFANPQKDVYTWNDTQPNALEAFVTGKAAMYLGYHYDLDTIKTRAPKLKFGIAPVPQVVEGGNTNFANYWMLGVSQKSKHKDIAWDFLLGLTTNPKAAKAYLDATGKPTALRSLITAQSEDDNVGVWANQILTAQSWYRGAHVADAEEALGEMIETIPNTLKPIDVLNLAAQRVAVTLTPTE